jgi:hypothetical protein
VKLVEQAPGSGGTHAGQREGSRGSPEHWGTGEGGKMGLAAVAISSERRQPGAVRAARSGEGE